jgi:hypothetical protein
VAFRRSFDGGFGLETDVRDLAGTLVISHDMPAGGEMSFAAFLGLLGGRDLPLALNVKADGLVEPLVRAMATAGVSDWFVFDMSIPDTLAYLDAGVPVYVRMSECEPESPLLERASGVWLDAFFGDWYGPDRIESLLGRGKRVCVVSPELHRRSYESLWQSLERFSAHPGLALCTDHPERARVFFGGLQPSAR